MQKHEILENEIYGYQLKRHKGTFQERNLFLNNDEQEGMLIFYKVKIEFFGNNGRFLDYRIRRIVTFSLIY